MFLNIPLLNTPALWQPEAIVRRPFRKTGVQKTGGFRKAGFRKNIEAVKKLILQEIELYHFSDLCDQIWVKYE